MLDSSAGSVNNRVLGADRRFPKRQQKIWAALVFCCLMTLTIQQVKSGKLDTLVLSSCLSPVLSWEDLTSTKQVCNSTPSCQSWWFSSAMGTLCFYLPLAKRQSSAVPCSCISLPSPLLRLPDCEKLECSSVHPQWACRTEKVMNTNQVKARDSHLWHCWYPLR